MIYSVIDVETTGRGNKITEISIFKTDGVNVIEEFTSLVNPKSLIPRHITALTGIDNLMVADAPTFEEISAQILEITADCVFVAHNVNFDYNVIRNEFKEIGIDFRRRKLCTVRLSRKLFPGLKSYSLGKLCKSQDIEIIDRHRARGDAEATTVLFKKLIDQPDSESVFSNCFKRDSKESTLPPNLPAEVFNKLPNSAGIYYFKDKKGKIIYVGKAKNLRKRVLGHFYHKSDKELTICRETADVDFRLSGSELIALLMEDAAIKHHFPKYNRASKKPIKKYAIFSYEDRQGVLHLAFNNQKSIRNPIQYFYGIRDCRIYLEEVCEKYNLCPKYCHLQEGVAECDHYRIDNCLGVCKGKEKVKNYNLRVNKAITAMQEESKNIILKEEGRTKDEESFIMLRDGKYLGYGFISREEQIVHEDQLETFLIRQHDNMDVQRILRKSIMNPKSYFRFSDVLNSENSACA
ncbi:DNA polymerase-3 subunit epsilon [Flavobacteriaceae bacterium MAR_2010_188]|nr:DNA polymerase-3 subunit epsilon [Flavobacteriaceae bacterium MAR_2010_188]